MERVDQKIAARNAQLAFRQAAVASRRVQYFTVVTLTSGQTLTGRHRL